MNLKYPDYENSLVNLAASVLEHFGIHDSAHAGLPLLAPYLQEDCDNIVVLLLDGMGTSVLRNNLDDDGFFRSHLAGSYSSVFPPTTVAATTSILSAMTPTEHSWLGWDCYYPQIDRTVTVFRNTITGTKEPAADYNVAETYCGYQNILEKINEHGGSAFAASPFAEPYPQTFAEICDRIRELCGQPGKKYIYAYWAEPDHTMHRQGCQSDEAKAVLRDLELQVQLLSKDLQNTLLLVTADHGHIDSDGVLITDYPAITDCLVRLPSLEQRALSFYVKEGMEAQFEQEFQKAFGEKFLLMTKAEFLEKKLFGPGVPHPCFDGMSGNYLAIATGDVSIYCDLKEGDFFKSVHAGMTEEEMIIPLIVVKR